ncbi:hypothetical protein, partial [Salmonella sp. SAL4445]|uniref:hypothetical protein n=1 Tax=Salmonella sp. SAL4445 TaxID=3159900 RepID=UPI00397CA00F
TPPAEPVDTDVDPTESTAIAAAWMTALCHYDHHGARTDNQHAAARYGDTTMPGGADPWTLTPAAWRLVTARRLASGCTDIT